MSRRVTSAGSVLFCAIVALTGMVVVCSTTTPAAGKDQLSLSDFMRKKLEASSRILEGITTEDAELVKGGADTLLEMSKAEVWNVLTDNDYREFNRDFRSSVQKLKVAAEKGNFDNATLQWIDSVKGCVECHKYVRSVRPVIKK